MQNLWAKIMRQKNWLFRIANYGNCFAAKRVSVLRNNYQL